MSQFSCLVVCCKSQQATNTLRMRIEASRESSTTSQKMETEGSRGVKVFCVCSFRLLPAGSHMFVLVNAGHLHRLRAPVAYKNTACPGLILYSTSSDAICSESLPFSTVTCLRRDHGEHTASAWKQKTCFICPLSSTTRTIVIDALRSKSGSKGVDR